MFSYTTTTTKVLQIQENHVLSQTVNTGLQYFLLVVDILTELELQSSVQKGEKKKKREKT